MSLHCDNERILWPLTISQAERLLYGRLRQPDMAKIIQAHRDYDKYIRVHSDKLNKPEGDASD